MHMDKPSTKCKSSDEVIQATIWKYLLSTYFVNWERDMHGPCPQKVYALVRKTDCQY